jgi:hypothetical protein
MEQRKMGKKYLVDFANRNVIYRYITAKGNELISRFTMFTDSMGVKIFTREGVVYLTEENCEVM